MIVYVTECWLNVNAQCTALTLSIILLLLRKERRNRWTPYHTKIINGNQCNASKPNAKLFIRKQYDCRLLFEMDGSVFSESWQQTFNDHV